jgi:hypothetical protein
VIEICNGRAVAAGQRNNRIERRRLLRERRAARTKAEVNKRRSSGNPEE